jgi:hypothetical protein
VPDAAEGRRCRRRGRGRRGWASSAMDGCGHGVVAGANLAVEGGVWSPLPPAPP